MNTSAPLHYIQVRHIMRNNWEDQLSVPAAVLETPIYDTLYLEYRTAMWVRIINKTEEA